MKKELSMGQRVALRKLKRATNKYLSHLKRKALSTNNGLIAGSYVGLMCGVMANARHTRLSILSRLRIF